MIFLDDSDPIEILDELIDTSDELRGVVNKLMLPIITAEEWQVIRTVFPEARAVAKVLDGRVYAYDKNVVVEGNQWCSDWQWRTLRCYFLDARFADIPWRESLVKYEAAS